MALARTIALVLAFVGFAGPPPAAAQPAAGTHRIAFVNIGDAASGAVNVAAFRAGLAALGYVEGRNLVIDFRWADQDEAALPGLIADLVRKGPAVILSTGGPVTLRAVKGAVTKIPVVFTTGDPVAEGAVASYAKPGGNLTGLAVLAGDLDAKRLELLAQLAPRAQRIAVVWNPAQPRIEPIMRNVDAAARRLGVTLQRWPAGNRRDLERAFAAIANAKPDALLVVADPTLGFERERIVEFARAQRLPGVYFWREFAELGGLASYGTNLASVYRRAATYVDRILKGARPADLPVEQPTTFDLVINARTAKELGVAIPAPLLARADEVIQ